MKLKTKDYIFLGMATVLSLVIYMIAMVLSSFLGAFGHSISPGIWGLLGGVVFVYICYNFNKFGIFTVFIALHMIIFLNFFNYGGIILTLVDNFAYRCNFS